MNNPKFSMIAAVAENLAIGKNNDLLWHISEDLKHFKNVTKGHAVIMGQKTFESLPFALPGRTNIVLTLDKEWSAKGAVPVYSIEEAMQKAREVEEEEAFVIGGGSIYKQFLPLVEKLYITEVKGEFEADVFFPDYSEFKNVVSKRDSQEGDYKYTFLELTR